MPVLCFVGNWRVPRQLLYLDDFDKVTKDEIFFPMSLILLGSS